MTDEQKERLEFWAYHKERKRTYKVCSLGVHGDASKRLHTLFDAYCEYGVPYPDEHFDHCNTFVVTDEEVEIMEVDPENIGYSDVFLRELGKTVLAIDWVKIGERFELDCNYDGGGWEFLAKAWRDERAFGVYSHIFHRFHKHYHWLDFLDGGGISLNDNTPINILEYLEELSKEEKSDG